MMKKILTLLIVLCIFLFLSKQSFAADFTSEYKVEYFIKELNSQLINNVRFNIKITHLRSDVFVKKFSLIFPKYFEVKDVTASDDKGAISPRITRNDKQTSIEVEFNEPKTGKGSENNFYISFIQDNLFKINGNIWEVILPLIENQDDSNYTVIVNLPEESDKKISIAKPKPNHINGKQLIWNNPKTRTIYAVFGEKQFYQTKLTYNLSNPRLVPVYTDIAFPPDSLYQQIFINNISPKPNKVLIDDDNNYLGRYYLKPKENKVVTFNGIIVTSSHMRPEYQELIKTQIESEKKYLLTEQPYWKIKSPEKFTNLKTANDIYSFVVNSLKYDFAKLNTKEGRMGASKALELPNNAVCTEFTDLFIGLAREKGIFSREIEGYGFSADPQLRPLSLVSDTLHAWPEYYDANSQIWISVDPTWENTSGIDYYNSFDLNHIVFVIHGKDPDYPYPAGSYKTVDSKNILIQPVNSVPTGRSEVSVNIENLSNTFFSKKKYRSKIIVTNNGNIFLYRQKIVIKSSYLGISPSYFEIDQIAPLQTKEFYIDIIPEKVITKKEAEIVVLTNANIELYRKGIKILPQYYDLALKYGYLGLALLSIILIIRYGKRNR